MLLKSKLILLIVFADYTLTFAQLLLAKVVPVCWYKNKPIYGRWVSDLGYIFAIGEPFDFHRNPDFFPSLSSAKNFIDLEERKQFVTNCNKLKIVAYKLKIKSR